MTRATFQGRIRTTAGRPGNTVNRDTGQTMTILRQNLAGPIQIQLQDPADGDHVVGMLPAYFVMTEARLIVPADAGTVDMSLPAYNGLSAVDLVGTAAAADDPAGTAIVLAAGAWASYAMDRPLVLTTASVTGLLNVGVWGFPLDDGTDELN